MTTEDTLDPLGGRMTDENRASYQQESRCENLQVAFSLGGVVRRSRSACACELRAWRPFGWQHWLPGVIRSPSATELTGQLEPVPHIAAIDGLIWLTLGSEQRVFSAKALRELADIADSVDSTKPETWVRE